MSHLSSATQEAPAATSITVARPAGAGAAHILIAAVFNDSPGAGPLPMNGSTGWTRFVTRTHTAYASSEVSLFWALGDVAALTFTIPGGSSGNLRAEVSAFAGRNLTTPIDDFDTAESVSASIAVPAMTAAANDADVLSTWSDFQANISGPITGGAPGGYTDRFNDNTPPEMHVIVSTAEGLAAGAIASASRACGNFTAKLAVGVVIAAAGGGGGGGGGYGYTVTL